MINVINNIIDELTLKHKLPAKGLYILENKGAKGSTYTFVINEQPFPVINENVIRCYKTYFISTIFNSIFIHQICNSMKSNRSLSSSCNS